MEKSKIQIQKELEFAAVQQNTGICESYSYCRFCKEPKKVLRNSMTPCADAYLDLKDITIKIENYKDNKEYIEVAKERIELWVVALNSTDEDELWKLFDSSESVDLGMPKAKYKLSSPIESELIKKEITREQVKTWIQREQEKLDSTRKEVYSLERAFKQLKDDEMFLVECKCWDKMKWKDIVSSYEIKYNKKIDDTVLRRRLVRIKEKIHNFLKRSQK
jgi:hypothetical protein